MVEFVTVTGPAAWASYLINGDASGLVEDEQAKADAWLEREGLKRVVSDACDEDGESQEARFTWAMGLYAPELDCAGGDVLDYIAEPIAWDVTDTGEGHTADCPSFETVFPWKCDCRSRTRNEGEARP